MPTWGWILIAAIVVIVALIVVRSTRTRRSKRLKKHFGPEYDRAVGEAGGPRAAEKELTARQRKRDKLDIVALPAAARAKYADWWRAVQTAFVDDPSCALGDADRLVTEVMRERGYPLKDFEERAADISVDHPRVVENYRAAHRIHLSQRPRQISTEEQRQAFVHYRALFDELLAPEDDKNKPQEASA